MKKGSSIIETKNIWVMKTLSAQELNGLSRIVLDAAMTVHREMGPGLLESVYHHCMLYELRSRDVSIQSNVSVPLVYKNNNLEKEYVVDLQVENEIQIELKAVETILPVHQAQLLSYLRLTNKRLGLLINFNVPLLKHGFHRIVNKL